MADEVKSTKATRFNSLLDSNKSRILKMAKAKKEKKEEVTDKQKRAFLKALANNEDIELEDGRTVSAQKAYAEELIEKTTMGVEAQFVFGDFLNTGEISPEAPRWYTLDNPLPDKGRIFKIAQHGGAPQETVLQEGADVVRIDPYMISSDTESMVKFNLRQGDISNEEKLRSRIEEGMAEKIEDDAKTLLENGLFTDISTVNGIYISDRVAEYPTSNDKDLSSEAGFTLEVFKQIAKHFDMLGKKVRNIYIPSNRRYDLWDWMSIPSGYSETNPVAAEDVVPQALHEQIVRTGSVNNLFGYSVNLVPLNTLNGTAGNGDVNAWVSTDQGCGEYRTVPEVSDVYREEDAKRIYLTENRAVAMFQVPNQRLNYARFRVE